MEQYLMLERLCLRENKVFFQFKKLRKKTYKFFTISFRKYKQGIFSCLFYEARITLKYKPRHYKKTIHKYLS